MEQLEAPRFVMGMNKNDGELKEIVDEIKAFLRGRETSLNQTVDLANASTIHQVNQQTRAFNKNPDDRLTQRDGRKCRFSSKRKRQ